MHFINIKHNVGSRSLDVGDGAESFSRDFTLTCIRLLGRPSYGGLSPFDSAVADWSLVLFISHIVYLQ